MIERVLGKILEKSPSGRVVVGTPGGVGYAVTSPMSTTLRLPPEGTEAELYTRTVWGEKSAELYGFLTRPERDAFDILLSVNKVGPKLALTLLSSLDPPDLARAVAEQDLHRLSSVKGIGLKTAERIMLELKDKAGKLTDAASAPDAGSTGGPGGAPAGQVSEASSALQNMGYTRVEAEKALRGIVPPPGKSGDAVLEHLIREALKALGRRL
ncbi:MAG: Holliday junction branch migration protein RuvA [Deltaproteobacteria bacterium]|jgi:Holliday junction DNA helicase RuvA|nr:Holliday junction branch migration protein RuvA [Deltaproteobacteria bacterium]